MSSFKTGKGAGRGEGGTGRFFFVCVGIFIFFFKELKGKKNLVSTSVNSCILELNRLSHRHMGLPT